MDNFTNQQNLKASFYDSGANRKIMYVILVILFAMIVALFAFSRQFGINEKNINDSLSEKEKFVVLNNLRESSEIDNITEAQKKSIVSDLRSDSEKDTSSREEKIDILNNLRGINK